jgi:hypothetical protein
MHYICLLARRRLVMGHVNDSCSWPLHLSSGEEKPTGNGTVMLMTAAADALHLSPGEEKTGNGNAKLWQLQLTPTHPFPGEEKTGNGNVNGHIVLLFQLFQYCRKARAKYSPLYESTS